MARSRRKSAASETSKTLVAFLVFFILTTIGSGVGAYYGFAEQEQLRKDKLEAEKTAKKADEEAALFRFLYNYSRPYFGLEPTFGLETGNEALFAAGMEEYLGRNARVGSNYPADQGEKLIDEAKKYTEKLKEFAPVDSKVNRPYNPEKGPPAPDPAAEKKPSYTVFDMKKDFEDRVARITKEKEAVAGKFDPAGALIQKGSLQVAQEELENEKKRMEAVEAGLTQAKQQFQNTIAQNKTKFTTAQDDLAKRFRQNYETKFDEAKRVAAQNADLQKQLENAISKLTDLRKEVQTAEREILQLRRQQQKAAEAVAEKPLAASARVVRVDRSQKRAYIDLSERSGLKKGVTFSIYEADPAGRPTGQPKGTVEVVDVQPTLSVVAIRTLYHPEGTVDRYGRRGSVDPLSLDNINPVKIGDVLVNPTWDPNRKTYIALAGLVDLNGDGYNQVETLVRALERQNVVVDVYQDPRDGSLKGRGVSNDPRELEKSKGFTTKTTMLVLGRSPGETVSGAARLDARGKSIVKGMGDLRIVAKDKGVRIVQLERFLDEVGYPRPTTRSAVDKVRDLAP